MSLENLDITPFENLDTTRSSVRSVIGLFC